MKSDVFKVELNRIEDENIKSSTITMLEMIPAYFYKIPASSSGRFHPQFSLGDGGLVRHVKVAMKLLEDMFNDSAFCAYEEHTKDLMRMALLLHDCFKSGVFYSGHTEPDHPLIMADYLIQNKDKLSLSDKDIEFVSRIIRCHMGPWNTDKKGKEILPVPRTKEELLVHLCDYISSRNYLNVAFEGNEIVDSASREKKLELK